MSEPQYQHLQVERDPRGIVTIMFNRPEVRNAFDDTTIAELITAFEKIGENAHAVVLRGAGPVFCAGGDLRWMARMGHRSWEENLADARRLTHMLEAVNSAPVPTMAVVQGAAIGGGLGLLCACDIVIAEENAIFKISEPRLGLVPACIAPFMLVKLGTSVTRYLCLSGVTLAASKALEAGIVHEVIPMSKLAEATEIMTAHLLESNLAALRTTKSLLLDLILNAEMEQEPASLLATFRAVSSSN